MYLPEFRNDVAVVDGFGQVISFIHPRYCATNRAAEEFAKVVPDLKPQIFYAFPLDFAPASPYKITAQVPWVKFANGSVHNVGLLIGYWERYDPVNAERFCRQEIAVSAVEKEEED